MASNLTYCLTFSAILILHISECAIKYNPLTEMCCEGAIFKKLAADQRCCGAAAYSGEDRKCCNGALHPVPDEQRTDDNHWHCCFETTGNSSRAIVYNAKTRQCCNGKVLVKPEPTMYNCCDGQLYSSVSHACCDQKLVELGPGLACCGSAKVYNTSAQMCCVPAAGPDASVPYQLHDKDGRRRCCGMDLYDASISYCCNGNIFPLPESMLDKERHGEDCCGNEIKPVSEGPLQCHNGRWVELNSTDFYFCGDQLFNVKVDTCCGNQMLALSSGLSCCWGIGMPYDPKTQLCCSDAVVPLTEQDRQIGATSCCGAKG